MEEIKSRAKNIIFKITVAASPENGKNSFHLDFEDEKYRQTALCQLIRDTVPYFALTKEELAKIDGENFARFQRRAWNRISKRPSAKKGDYGELLLFLILEVFYPARKFATKVRLRSSYGDEIKGYDCAHFSIDDGSICLWLGEAKFHQSFSTAISKAIESIEEHSKIQSLKDEISLLEGNVELDGDERKQLEELLSSDMAIEKMKFKIPILLTFDSNVVPNHKSISDEFINELKAELNAHYATIDGKSITVPPNIELLFILLPLEEVAKIKEKLEAIEAANR